MDQCPNDERLTHFVAEELPPSERTPLEAHIEHCKFCQKSLERLTADSLVQAAVASQKSAHHAGTHEDGIDPDRTRTIAPITRSMVHPDLTESGLEILAEVGRGSMGVVYQARQVKLNRMVALKAILAGSTGDGAERARFRIEAEAIARLQHPNIIQIYEILEINGGVFLALEYCAGGSLAQLLSAHPLTANAAAKLIADLANAMDAAHHHGVIHRDLKPANVLLTEGGSPKITDFGVAKLGNQPGLTATGSIIGTPCYMAPEQAGGRLSEICPATDVYALGAILYECLTGRPPFKAATVPEMLMQVVQAEPVPPRQLQPRTPRDLDTICLKCLEKKPSARYTAAHALAADLKRFLDDQPIQARRINEIERAARWSRKNPLAAGSLFTVVAVFLTAFALVVLSYLRSEVARRNEANQRRAADLARDTAIQKEKDERWERYRANIVAAANALEVRNTASARVSLAEAPVEHRNWEWHYFRAQLDCAHSILGEADNVVWVFPFRGRHYSRSIVPKEGRIRLVDPRRDIELAVLKIDDAKRTEFFPSPDGTLIASASDEGTVRLWEIATCREIAHWQFAKGPTWLLFLPNSTRMVVRAADRTLRLLDLTQRTEPAILATGAGSDNVHQLAISEDSLRVAAVLDESHIGIWDTATGERISDVRFDAGKLAYAIALSPDGRRLLTGGGYPDNSVRLWDTATGQITATRPGFRNYITAIEFSPDGSRVAASSVDQTVSLLDGANLQLITNIRGHTELVERVLFSSDSRRLLTSSLDRSLGLWDAATGDPISILLGHGGLSNQVIYSRDGAGIISRNFDHTDRYWDVTEMERRVLRGHTNFVYDVAVSGDGTKAASAAWDGTVRLWDLASGKQIGLFRHDEEVVGGVALSPNGQLVASVPRSNTVCVWDTAGKLRHTLKASTGRLTDPHLAFNPQGTLLAQGGQDGVVRVWNPVTGELVHELPTQHAFVTDVAFSPDGTTVAVAEEKGVRVWDLATEKQLAYLGGFAEFLERVAFSPDGRRIAAGGRDKTARIWDATTYQELAKLEQGSQIYGLAFSPDNSRLATACADNTIRLWDMATFREVGELRGHGSYVHAVAFTPDGTRLVSGSGDFTVRIWDTLSPEERSKKNLNHRGTETQRR